MGSILTSEISQFFIGESLTQRLKLFFDDAIIKDGLSPGLATCTINGIQTPNLINLIDKSCIEEIYTFVKKHIDAYHSDHLQSYEFFIDHMHAIKYTKDGYQIAHTHHMFEDHSFIIYLNNSNAVTKIYHENNFSEVKSAKGKIVIFSAALLHESTKCDGEREILVGSIKFSTKKWLDRRKI